MKKSCANCFYWKTYRKFNTMCACEGLSSGTNPGAQLYTSADDLCKIWKKRKSINRNFINYNIKKLN